ncbi:ionotropic receptor 25a-like isoform X2 [Centruroides sculpturatus]|uniref:ionotropic receptor 25a-like isoform X2 n=1 Tax=Centruroides sculpturatus TaxID=218467 RepID=UPI000C6EBF72|nr:ionotropic receptor 25a-like isoform X2 [Centruroides sculpturatus]
MFEMWQLLKKEADISPGTFELRFDNYRNVDFSAPILIKPKTFLLKPRKHKIGWHTIANVLRLHVWLAVLGSLLLFGFYLRWVIKDKDNKPWPVASVYWFLFTTMTNQGVDMRGINRFVSRICFLMWVLSISVLLWGYGGVLSSLLAVQVNEPVPTTLEQLAAALERREYSCLYIDDNSFILNLNKSEIGYMKTLAKHFDLSLHFWQNQLEKDAEIKKKLKNVYTKLRISKVSNLEAKALLAEMYKILIKLFGETTKVAIIGSPDLIKVLTMDSDDEYFVSDDVLSTKNEVLMMKKGFPHKNKIDKLIRRLFDTGLFIKMSGDTLFESKLKSSNDCRPLSLQDLLGPFSLLIVGYALSFSCFLAEFFVGMTLNRIAPLL